MARRRAEQGWTRSDAVQRALESAPAQPGARRIRCPCPFCEAERGKRDVSLALSVERGTGLWYCWRCQEGGKITAPDPDAAPDPLADAPDPNLEEPNEVSLPDGFACIGEGAGLHAEVLSGVRAYAASRNVTPAIAQRLGLGGCAWGRYAQRLVAPIYSRGGERVCFGWVARDTTGTSESKYLYPHGMSRGAVMYGGEALLTPSDDPAMIVEGFMDTIPYAGDAAAVLGSPSRRHVQMMLESPRPIAIVLDRDVWPKAWSLAMLLRFEGKRAGAVCLPGTADPDEVDPAWLREEARRSLDAPL
jgi:hypothetical protein